MERTTELVRFSEVQDLLSETARRGHSSFSKMSLLFAGDNSCDEAVVVKDGDRIIAVASIAPFGELRNVPLEKAARHPDYRASAKRLGWVYKRPKSTIVGIFVFPEYRRQGLGLLVLEAAIRRIGERSREKAHIQLLSAEIKALVKKLNPDLRKRLQIGPSAVGLEEMRG
jgi:GNAT superfamily N-acetyltransferase